MRFFPALLCIASLIFVPAALAAQKPSARAPAKAPAQTTDKPAAPAEKVYLESEVSFDEVNQAAYDNQGVPISGTIQGFYPNGRLAWTTQWLDGKLHGITRGYYENRKLKEETTWVNGKMNGLARWYDQAGKLRRESMFEDDKDLAAPAGAQAAESSEDKAGDAPAGQDPVHNAPAGQDKAGDAPAGQGAAGDAPVGQDAAPEEKAR
jgi:hypothetical protein